MNEDDPKLVEAAEALADRTPYPWDAVAGDDGLLRGMRMVHDVARAHHELPEAPESEHALAGSADKPPPGGMHPSPHRIRITLLVIAGVLLALAAAAAILVVAGGRP